MKLGSKKAHSNVKPLPNDQYTQAICYIGAKMNVSVSKYKLTTAICVKQSIFFRRAI